MAGRGRRGRDVGALGGLEEDLFELPTDTAGLVRRECRRCHRIFKIRAGALDGEAVQRVLAERLGEANREELPASEPERFCPYCGVAGPEHGWLTAEQRSVVEKRADHLRRELRHVQLQHPQKTLAQNPNVTYLAVAPAPFEAKFSEQADVLRAFPLLCCRETVRLTSAWHGPVHCYFCGTVHDVPRVTPGFLDRLARFGVDF